MADRERRSRRRDATAVEGAPGRLLQLAAPAGREVALALANVDAGQASRLSLRDPHEATDGPLRRANAAAAAAERKAARAAAAPQTSQASQRKRSTARNPELLKLLRSYSREEISAAIANSKEWPDSGVVPDSGGSAGMATAGERAAGDGAGDDPAQREPDGEVSDGEEGEAEGATAGRIHEATAGQRASVVRNNQA